MGQCRTLDADVTIGCYCGDYSSCDNVFPTSLFIWKKYFSLTLARIRKRRLFFLYRQNSIMLIVIDLVLVPFSSQSS